MLVFRRSLLSTSTFRLVGISACVLLLVLSLGRCSRGQAADAAKSYTWDTIDPAYAELKDVATQRNAKDAVLMGRSSLANSRVAVENWYRKYLFPAMSSQEHLSELRENRDGLLNRDLDIVSTMSDQATHQFLVDLAFEEASRRVTGNYHPAVRFNAMLIIGGLNQTESRLVGTDRYPAVRLAKAFDFMLDEYKKADQTDAVRIAAMLGLERHVRLVRQRPQDQPIPDARKAEVAALMKTLVEEKTPAAGRSQSGHTWMRRCGVDCLAALGQVGDGQSIFNTFVALVDDSSEPLSLRCTAARALSELSYTDVTGIDAVATAQKLGALAASACRNEDALAKDQEKELEAKTSKSRRGGGLPGMGMGMGMGGSGYPGMEGMGGYPGMGESGPPGIGGGSSYPGMPGGIGGYPGMPGGGGGYPGLGGSNPRRKAVSDEMDELIENVRRRLKLPIYCVQLGIRGESSRSNIGSAADTASSFASVARLATDQQQKTKIQEIVAALDELIGATDPETDDGLDDMLAEVRAKTLKLEALLPKPAQTDDKASDAGDLPGADLPGAGGEAVATPPSDKS